MLDSDVERRTHAATARLGAAPEPKHKGLFVAFEGGEGSGKSTQAQALANMLADLDHDVVLTREPGGTIVGEQLRQMLLTSDAEPLTQKTEALLFLADRAQHVETVIRPALDRGAIVICDRYVASTIAHQVYGNGLDQVMIRSISSWAADQLKPNVVYFLNVPVVKGLERAKRQDANRFEDKSVEYHKRVRAGYLAEADGSWYMTNGMRTIQEIHEDIARDVMRLIDDLRVNRTSPVEKVTYLCPICSQRMDKGVGMFTYQCPNGHGEMKFTVNL